MILRVQGQGELESRSFALTDMVRWGYSDLRNVSPGGATAGAVAGIPAINRAARMRAEAVASLDLGCWRGTGVQRTKVDRVWQANLFSQARYNDWQTRFDFWEAVEESLSYRGNAYVWKLVDQGRIVQWFALHPDQVKVQGDGRYEVRTMAGYVDPVGKGNGRYTVDNRTIIHFRGHGQGGTGAAPSPIKVFQDALGAPIARTQHELRMWNRGTMLQGVVTFPQGVTSDQADTWREMWKATYEGMEGDTTAVLGGGATFQTVGMTFDDAMFVDMAHLTVEDASRIMGVPANLLGAQLNRSVPNLEQDLAAWLRFGLGPELERIETTLAADPDLFPMGATTYPRFDTDEFVRGELITEANIMHLRIQDGTLTPDESRAALGLPPHPNGMGATPQITPVGGAPNAQTPPIPSTIPKSVAED